MKILFSRLSRREQWLIGLGFPILLILAGWLYIWRPLDAERAVLRSEIAELRTIQLALDRYPMSLPFAPIAQSRNQTPVSSRVTRSADSAGIVLARLEPLGAGLTVLVDSATFDDLIAWINVMETEEGLRLSGIGLTRRAEPGVVSARLELEDAS